MQKKILGNSWEIIRVHCANGLYSLAVTKGSKSASVSFSMKGNDIVNLRSSSVLENVSKALANSVIAIAQVSNIENLVVKALNGFSESVGYTLKSDENVVIKESYYFS